MSDNNTLDLEDIDLTGNPVDVFIALCDYGQIDYDEGLMDELRQYCEEMVPIRDENEL